MAIRKIYTHRETGVEQEYPATIARRFPDLVEKSAVASPPTISEPAPLELEQPVDADADAPEEAEELS